MIEQQDNVYVGAADGSVTVNGIPLNPRYDFQNHSPAGFAWGYFGSGPAQLAFAILAEEFGPVWADTHSRYQAFKADVLAVLNPEVGFRLTSADLMAWKRQHNASMLASGASHAS